MTAENQEDINEVLKLYIYRCALSEKDALKALYEITSPRVFATLLRILKNKQLAEEALQDVYVRVWHRAAYYHSDKGKAMTWLLSIARYRALDMIRKKNRRIDPIDEEFDESDVDNSESSACPVNPSSSDFSIVQFCLDKLNAVQQKSIRLAYLDGYTHGEISEALKKPLGTIKTWIRRGLQSLKNCIENEV